MAADFVMAKNNKTEIDLISEIDEQLKLSKRYLDPVHSRFNQIEELYRSYINASNYPHNAQVFDPRVFRVIETVTPRMVANEPTGSFYPTEEGDIGTAQLMNELIKYDWRRAEMFPKLVNFVKSMLIFGTAFGRTYWDFRETDRTRMVPKKIGGRTVWTPKNTETVKVTEFDGPNFEVLNIYDCFPDPNATSLHNMRWFLYRTFKTLKELEAENDSRGYEYYKNLDKLKEAISDKNNNKKSSPQDMQYREHRRTMLSTEELHGEDESNPEFAVFHRLTREGWCATVPEYKVVIREIENPLFSGDLPIIYGVDYPYPGELYGMGEIEPVERIQRAINAVLNQRLDNVQLVLRNMWKVRKGAQVDMHTLVSAPGNIVTTGDMAAVEMLEVPDVTGPTFVQTMGYLTSSLQNGSGITDYTVGIDQNKTVGNSTATGTRLIQQEANAQFKLKIQLFNKMTIERIANQWKDLRIQYTTDKQVVRITEKPTIKYLRENTQLASTSLDGLPVVPGEETQSKLTIGENDSFAFLTVFPDDIQPSVVGDYDFVASASSEQLNDPVAMQENFFTAIDRTIGKPEWIQGLASQGKRPNFANLTEKIFDKLSQGLEEKDIIEDIPQIQPGVNPLGQPQPPVSADMSGMMPTDMPPIDQIPPQMPVDMPNEAPMSPEMMGGLNV